MVICETVFLRRLAGLTEPDAGASDSSREEAVEGLLKVGKRVVDPSLITGVKYLGRLYSLMERLAPAGNRRLLFSQYAGLVWLGLFHPTRQSWRGLSEASRLRKVQQALGGPRASLGSLSESVRVFDPQLLEPVFQELFAQLPQQQIPRQTARGSAAGITFVAVPAAAMLEQVADRDLALSHVELRPRLLDCLFEIEDIVNLVIELQFALLDERQDRDGGDRFGDAGDAEQARRLNLFVLGEVRVAITSRQDEPPMIGHRQRGTWNRMLLHEVSHQLIEAGQFVIAPAGRDRERRLVLLVTGTAQDSPRPFAGELAVVQHEDAVDDHMLAPFGPRTPTANAEYFMRPPSFSIRISLKSPLVVEELSFAP